MKITKIIFHFFEKFLKFPKNITGQVKSDIIFWHVCFLYFYSHKGLKKFLDYIFKLANFLTIQQHQVQFFGPKMRDLHKYYLTFVKMQKMNP